MIQDSAIEEIDSSHVVEEFIYDSNESERSAWKFGNDINLPRSEVVFVVQMFIIFSLTKLCIIKLAFSSSTCEETSVWISLLSSLVGYILPNPRLWTNLFQQKTRFSWLLWDPLAIEKRNWYSICYFVELFSHAFQKFYFAIKTFNPSFPLWRKICPFNFYVFEIVTFS